MPRSLIVLDQIPYPPIGGQQLRYRQTIEALARLGEVRLLCLAPSAAGRGGSSGSPPVAFLDPKPRKSALALAAGLLAPQLKARLREAQRRRFMERLRGRTRRAIAQAAPDVVVVASAELAVFLPPLASLGVPVIYDSHNVERVLWQDLTRLRGELGEDTAKTGFRDRILAGEAALVAGAAQLWVCSSSDAELFVATYGPIAAGIRVVPNTVDVESFRSVERAPATAARDAAPSLLFTGNFGYPPNVESALWLEGEILPLVRRSAPGCRLVLCGRNPPEALLALAQRDPGIEVTGEVPDVRPWLGACDVVVVPLRHGGGTRLKILEALAAGCPVVSTAKGAEGLEVEHGRDLLLAETPEAIGEAVLWCLADPAAAAAMALRGRALVAARYSWQANLATVASAMAALGLDSADSSIGAGRPVARPC